MAGHFFFSFLCSDWDGFCLLLIPFCLLQAIGVFYFSLAIFHLHLAVIAYTRNFIQSWWYTHEVRKRDVAHAPTDPLMLGIPVRYMHARPMRSCLSGKLLRQQRAMISGQTMLPGYVGVFCLCCSSPVSALTPPSGRQQRGGVDDVKRLER